MSENVIEMTQEDIKAAYENYRRFAGKYKIEIKSYDVWLAEEKAYYGERWKEKKDD